jgi:ferredoxin
MTYLLMCADHATPEPPHADAHLVGGLCANPSLLALVPDQVDHLVVGIHESEVDLSRLQAEMRRLGLDPLGVGVIDLTWPIAPSELAVTLTGLTARTEAFAGATPEQVKSEPARRVSRRDLLSVPTPLSIGAPSIDRSRCAAFDGCRACVAGCPAHALAWEGGGIRYDKGACTTCGICVTTCPTGAVVDPTMTPGAIEAQLRAISAASPAPIGIRYICRTAETAPDAGFIDVRVACTGMLTPGWLLAPLALGVAAVNALGCDQAGCRLENQDRLAAARDDARSILDALGMEQTRFGANPDRELAPFVSTQMPLLGPGVDARVITALAEISGPPTPSAVSLGVGQVGSITIDTATCTACRMCAQLCPTDALTSIILLDAVSIEFDPALCVGCTQCLGVCPEIHRDAISLDISFDLADWAAGRREIRHEDTHRCERCGRTIAPAAMLERIGALLGPDHLRTLPVIAGLCIDCRGR